MIDFIDQHQRYELCKRIDRRRRIVLPPARPTLIECAYVLFWVVTLALLVIGIF